MKGHISFLLLYLLAKTPPRNLTINSARQVVRKDLGENLIYRYSAFVVCQVIDYILTLVASFDVFFFLVFSKEFGVIKASLEYPMTFQFTPEIKLLLHLIMTSIIITTTANDSLVKTCSALKLFFFLPLWCGFVLPCYMRPQ